MDPLGFGSREEVVVVKTTEEEEDLKEDPKEEEQSKGSDSFERFWSSEGSDEPDYL